MRTPRTSFSASSVIPPSMATLSPTSLKFVSSTFSGTGAETSNSSDAARPAAFFQASSLKTSSALVRSARAWTSCSPSARGRR